MIKKKLVYFNVITLTCILLYMIIHLFFLNNILISAQGSEGISFARLGFFDYTIFNKYGNSYTSITSPSVIIALFLLINFAFLIKFGKNKLVIVNIFLIAASLLLYQIFLFGINNNLEQTVAHDSYIFKKVSILCYEFMDIKTKDEIGRIVNFSLEKEYNLSIIPLVLSFIGSIIYLFRLNYLKQGNNGVSSGSKENTALK